MAKGVNKAIILGSLGSDPEIRYTANGAAIANISVATNDGWKDKTTGEWQDRVEWHRIVCFGKLAELCEQLLKKGSQAYFEGRIQTRKWQDKDGHDRYSTEIVSNEMQVLGSKRDAEQPKDYAKPESGNEKKDDFFDDASSIPF